MMKKFNFFKLFFVCISLNPINLHAFLTQEDIEGAKTLATSHVKLEEFTPSPNQKKHWLTIETFDFTYKGKTNTF